MQFDYGGCVMKTICWILIISMFLCSGCSSTRFVGYDEPSCAELNKKLVGKKGKITLKNGEVIKVENVSVTPDSTSWVESKLKSKKTVTTSEVMEISIKNHSKSVGTGLFFGLLGGGATGALIHYARDYKRVAIGFTPEQKYVIGNFILGLGGVVSWKIGRSIDITDKYVLSEPADSTSEGINKN